MSQPVERRIPELSLIIPAYNEAENLLILLPKLQQQLHGLDYEIIVVNNASTDNSAMVLENFLKIIPELKVVVEPILGYGRAVLTGLASARGKNLAVIRSDNQEKPEDLVAMYAYFKENHLDFCKAVRRSRRGEQWIRLPISHIYNFLFSQLFGLRMTDINAVPKIFTRAFFEQTYLESTDWFIDAEMVIKASQMHFKIGEVRIDYLPRLKGRSSVRPVHIYQFLRNMFAWHKRIRAGHLIAKYE